MVETNDKKVKLWIFRNLAWLLIVFAGLLMLILYLGFVEEQRTVRLIENASLAILSSGVFAAVLKSIQFTGLFKEEIAKVMVGTEFIQNRRDLPELWRAISKTIYNRKFPLISDNLEDIILNTYFPTKEDYYYEDYIVTIKIEKITDDFEIIYTQTAKYNVILDEKIENVQLVHDTFISQNKDAAESINKLEFFEVDGEKWNLKEDESTKDDPDNFKYVIELNGKGPFAIHSKYSRKYSLKSENYKLFRVKLLTKNMDVVINYPEDVCVSFFNIGMVNKFKEQHVEIKNQIIRTHRNDVILPHQGFGMSFEKNGKKKRR